MDEGLFKSYEADYCNRSTDIARKIAAIGSLSGGAQPARRARLRPAAA